MYISLCILLCIKNCNVLYTLQVNRALVCKGTKAVRTGVALDWRLRLLHKESTHSLHCQILPSIHPKLSTFTFNLPPIVKFNHQFTAKLSTFTYILPPIVKFLSIHPKLLIFTCNSPQIDFDWFQLEGNSQMAMVLQGRKKQKLSR